MPYIPKEHEKYDLLPFCREHGGEVFIYPSTRHIDDLLPDGVNIIPYGYNSYEEYFEQLNEYVSLYSVLGEKDILGKLISDYIADLKKLNVKEEWSVVKYIGPSTISPSGFTNGRHYYWPCTFEQPGFGGIIDDEEFTAYAGWSGYTLDKSDWEVAEDPTGMAAAFAKKASDPMTTTRNEYLLSCKTAEEAAVLMDTDLTKKAMPILSPAEITKFPENTPDTTGAQFKKFAEMKRNGEKLPEHVQVVLERTPNGGSFYVGITSGDQMAVNECDENGKSLFTTYGDAGMLKETTPGRGKRRQARDKGKPETAPGCDKQKQVPDQEKPETAPGQDKPEKRKIRGIRLVIFIFLIFWGVGVLEGIVFLLIGTIMGLYFLLGYTPLFVLFLWLYRRNQKASDKKDAAATYNSRLEERKPNMDNTENKMECMIMPDEARLGCTKECIYAWGAIKKTCEQCNGTGKKRTRICKFCNGTGITNLDLTISVTVPPGTIDGQPLVYYVDPTVSHMIPKTLTVLASIMTQEKTMQQFNETDLVSLLYGADAAERRKIGEANATQSITISVEQAKNGCTMVLPPYTIRKYCDPCGGSGEAVRGEAAVCAKCGGAGTIKTDKKTPFGKIKVDKTCKTCGGMGRIIKKPCKNCGGKGFFNAQDQVSLTVPAESAARVVFSYADKGHYIDKDKRGSLILTVSVGNKY